MTDCVAIILLNWNGLEDTLECIESLMHLNFVPYQVIVVDNHSDEDLSALTERFPQVLLIKNPDNYGFSKGNNIGISKAAEMGCQYCWVLNNDTEVDSHSLQRLVNTLETNPALGAVTNFIGYYNDRALSWFAGGIFYKGIPKHRGYFQRSDKEAVSEDTEYLSGCSFLARTDLLQRIGGFDENYFVYGEDVDISLRIRAQGLRLGYVDDAVVWHKVSRATGELSPVKLYYKHRNMLYFLKKFNRPIYQSLYWWGFSFKLIAVLLLKHRDPRAARFLVRGLWDGVSGKMGRLTE